MSDGPYKIDWKNQEPGSAAFANILCVTETICTPFTLRQFQLLGLLPPVDSHPRVLDNACGSGRQTEILREAYHDAGKEITIECCDISPGMIGQVEKRIQSGNWHNVQAHVINAEELNYPPNTFTHAFMSFGIMFPTDTHKVLTNMAAALPPGAPVSFTFWKRMGVWDLMHKAAICATSDPTLPAPKFYSPRWAHPETMVDALHNAGFRDIKVVDEDKPWKLESKNAFIRFATGVPQWGEYTKNWTAEQKDKVVDCALQVLDEVYPDAGHGPIEVPMVGFIATARKI